MSWTFVVLALVLFLFAIYIGFLCGQWACEKRVITKRDYWIANFAGAAAVILLTWVFSLFPLVQFAPIGWLGGFIAGLKMSFGESVGPWRKHDEVFNVNKAHRAAADANHRALAFKGFQRFQRALAMIQIAGKCKSCHKSIALSM